MDINKCGYKEAVCTWMAVVVAREPPGAAAPGSSSSAVEPAEGRTDVLEDDAMLLAWPRLRPRRLRLSVSQHILVQPRLLSMTKCKQDP